MSQTLQEFIGETDDQLESLLSSVERRTDVLRDHLEDEVGQEVYREEMRRTEEVREDLEEVGERVEYGLRLLNGGTEDPEVLEQDVELESVDPSEYRGKVALMKGKYDGLVNRLKMAEERIEELDEESGFEPAYTVVEDLQQG